MEKDQTFQSKISFRKKIILVLFGVCLFFVLLEVCLRLGGFIWLSIQEYGNLQSLKQKGAYRILCLGESTTGRQYGTYLEEILNKRNIGIKFSVIDEGTAGINTTTIISQLEGNLDKYQPQMVIAMMGINDGGERVSRENINTINMVSFLKSFRVYKLARLLWLHILNKTKEIEFCTSKLSWFGSGGDRSYLLRIGPNSAYAESIPTEGIELDSRNNSGSNLKDDKEYVQEAELYSIAGKFTDAEEAFKKAIAINPKNNNAYGLLIKLYWDYRYFLRSEIFFKEAIKINPVNEEAYYWMAVGYRIRGEYSSAEKLLRKTLEISPDNLSAVSELILVSRLQGKYSEIEDLLKRDIKKNPNSEYLYGMLAAFYGQMGRHVSANECYRKARKFRMQYYNPKTRDNYLKLKSVLDKRGIKLVCMEYPVRSVRPLKEVFINRDGMVFVDNEKIFKDALKKNNYEMFFRDMFGGEFGHCTEKGNRLLAQNIANTILKEVFGK
jgi:tetratricopeptide (TPR) repeat protein